MSRDYRLYLDDIIEAIRRIKDFTNGMEFDAFKADIKTQDAVVRNLEIIGEASGRLPEAVRRAAPEIEWRKVVGIRNILAHGYFGISLPIIWDVVQNKLDELSDACLHLVSESGDKGLGYPPNGNNSETT
jgi:uncharacterized protein with HEPN domain